MQRPLRVENKWSGMDTSNGSILYSQSFMEILSLQKQPNAEIVCEK